MQETRVCFLIWEDPTYPGATKPKHHNYQAWALDLGAATTETYFPKACALSHEEPPQWESHALQLESSPHSPQLEKNLCSSKDRAQPKIK